MEIRVDIPNESTETDGDWSEKLADKWEREANAMGAYPYPETDYGRQQALLQCAKDLRLSRGFTSTTAETSNQK